MNNSRQLSNGSRRERRIQRKRDEILEAATRVFAQKGYARATTKDIANEADIGESTLYNYFPGKRDILIAIANHTVDLFDDLFHEARGLENQEALIEMTEQGMEILTRRIDFTRTLLVEVLIDNDLLQNFALARINQVREMLKEFIAEQIAAGVFRPVDPELAARLALGMFAGMMIPILRGIEPVPGPEQRRRIAENVVAVLLNGIRRQTGLHPKESL